MSKVIEEAERINKMVCGYGYDGYSFSSEANRMATEVINLITELESKNKEIEQVNGRINEISNKECAGYPNIENADVFTNLWAIEQTLEGRILACDDLHAELERYKAVIRKYQVIHKPYCIAWVKVNGSASCGCGLYKALSNLKEQDNE